MKKIFKILGGVLLTLVISFVVINLGVLRQTRPYMYQQVADAPEAYTAIVLGARVYPSGRLSSMLEDRVLTAVELYKQGKVERILVSGDHGQPDYDEVNAMKDFLVEQGVSAEDIFLDHAGFDTFDSMYRAKEVFHVDSAVIVTQEFHLPRAVYIARGLGLDAYGVAADRQPYASIVYNKAREWPARAKSFLSVHFGGQPTYLGDPIHITGDASNSWD
jgi:SanA protein